MEDRYSVEQVIEAAEQAHGFKAHMARILGCSRRTIDNYAKRYPEIAEAIADQRETALDMVENKLFSKAIGGKNDKGDTIAQMFILKTIGRKRGYIEKQEIEHEGKIVVSRKGFEAE